MFIFTNISAFSANMYRLKLQTVYEGITEKRRWRTADVMVKLWNHGLFPLVRNYDAYYFAKRKMHGFIYSRNNQSLQR
jgi:hypothetical protein